VGYLMVSSRQLPSAASVEYTRHAFLGFGPSKIERALFLPPIFTAEWFRLDDLIRKIVNQSAQGPPQTFSGVG
jgi:hypothetical protein